MNNQTEFFNKLLQHIQKIATQLSKKAGRHDIDRYSLKNNPIYTTIEKFTKDLFAKRTITKQAITSFNFSLEYGIYRFILKKAAEYAVLLNCADPSIIVKDIKQASEVTLPEKECKNRILYDSMRSDGIRRFETYVVTGIRHCNARK